MCSSVSHSAFSDSWVDLSARKKMQGLVLWSLEVVEFEILTAQRSTVWHRQYIERSWGQEMTRPWARLEGEDNTQSLVHTLVHPCFFGYVAKLDKYIESGHYPQVHQIRKFTGSGIAPRRTSLSRFVIPIRSVWAAYHKIERQFAVDLGPSYCT